MNQKALINALVVLVVVLIAGVVYFAFFNKSVVSPGEPVPTNTPQQSVSPTKSVLVSPTPVPTVSQQVTQYKEYNNSTYGFSFKYPSKFIQSVVVPTEKNELQKIEIAYPLNLDELQKLQKEYPTENFKNKLFFITFTVINPQKNQSVYLNEIEANWNDGPCGSRQDSLGVLYGIRTSCFDSVNFYTRLKNGLILNISYLNAASPETPYVVLGNKFQEQLHQEQVYLFASLRVNYNEDSPNEVFKNQPGAVKSVTKNGDNWLVTVDLLSYKSDWLPGVNERFVNQSTKIRNLAVTTNTKTYNCDTDAKPSVLVNTESYMVDLQNRVNKERTEATNIGRAEFMTDWALYDFDINGTNIMAIYLPCLP